MRNFVFHHSYFGRIEFTTAANGNKQLVFLDSDTICDCIIDELRNMHASYVYDDLKDGEVYVEWLDCYSNALLSVHKLDDILDLSKLEEELDKGHSEVMNKGFEVDCWADMNDYQEFDD